MIKLSLSQVSAAALALAASAAVGAAQANEGTTYYYTDDTTGSYSAYSDTFAPSTNYYYDSNQVIVAPQPRIEYAPVYTERSNTTYYHSGSTHDGYVSSSPAYRTYYEPRVVYTPPATIYTAPAPTYSYSAPTYHYAPSAPPPGYVPPGLSINVGTGTYAPFYGGWNSYSMDNNGYRIGR